MIEFFLGLNVVGSGFGREAMIRVFLCLWGLFGGIVFKSLTRANEIEDLGIFIQVILQPRCVYKQEALVNLKRL